MFFWERDIEWTFPSTISLPEAGTVHKSLPRYPQLKEGFESSVPRLHFLGAPAIWSFGPLMQFGRRHALFFARHYFVASLGKLRAIAFGSANHSSPNSDNHFLAMSHNFSEPSGVLSCTGLLLMSEATGALVIAETSTAFRSRGVWAPWRACLG